MDQFFIYFHSFLYDFQLNPEHTVPTLVDGDFAIWDSHAICAYLVDKYGKDDKLYPKDLQLRAKCNQRLFFDAASLFVRMREFSLHFILRGGTDIPASMVDPIYVAFEILERFLASDPFLVGNHLTIADISVATTVSALQIYAPLKPDDHPKILAWLKRVKREIPFFDEVNAEPIETVRLFMQRLMQKNKLRSKL